jgi:hypothetical protein
VQQLRRLSEPNLQDVKSITTAIIFATARSNAGMWANLAIKSIEDEASLKHGRH